jgi:hypothetical protein
MQHFNGLDKFNKLWYNFEYTHAIKDWRPKQLLSILKFAIINTFSLSVSKYNLDLRELREKITNYFFSFYEN